jgi:hypothetical protein
MSVTEKYNGALSLGILLLASTGFLAAATASITLPNVLVNLGKKVTIYQVNPYLKLN